MGLLRRKPTPLARAMAMNSKPLAVTLPTEEGEDGGLVLLIAIPNARWHVKFSGRRETIKRFVLDRYGRDVYQRCDGKTPLLTIVERFAKANRLGIPEAEVAVITFLKTLVGKRLVRLQAEAPKGKS